LSDDVVLGECVQFLKIIQNLHERKRERDREKDRQTDRGRDREGLNSLAK
jgi:hypothetical protein